MARIISPVTIDLGAKYTGILFSQHDEGDEKKIIVSAFSTI